MKKIQNKLTIKLLSLVKVKSIRLDKVFPISNKLRDDVAVPLRKVIHLSMGRVTGLSNRVRISYNFVTHIMKMSRNHGTDFTVA